MRGRWLAICLLLAACGTHAPLVARSEALDLDPSTETQRLDGFVDVWIDRDHTLLGLGDVRDVARAHEFVSVGDRPYLQGRGAYDTPAWIRFTVRNPTDEPIERVLQLSQVTIDHVEAFPPGHPVEARGWNAGQDSDIATRVVRHPAPRFPILVGPGESQTWYVLLRDEGTIGTAMEIGTRDALEQAWSRRQTLDGGLVLLLAWVVVVALVLTLVERSSLLGLFTVAMAGQLVVELFYFWGVPAYIFPVSIRAPFVNRLNAFTTIFIWGGMSAFTVRLLRLDVHLPRTTAVLKGLVALLMVNSLYMSFVDYGSTLMLNHLSTSAGLIVLFVASLRRALAGDAVARALLASFALFLVSYLLLLAKTLGTQSPLTDAFFPASTILFVTGLLVALQRYTLKIRADREAATAGQLAELQRNARLSSTFERFVPKEFLVLLGHADVETLTVGRGVERPMTVLFSDIRGFTSMSEAMSAEAAYRFVNRYLGAMEPAIHAQGGFIDKYLGDGIMALFATDRGTDPPVRAAVEMVRALGMLNTADDASEWPTVQVGIGIHAGPLVLGTVGGVERISATVIGDAVNLASRVEGATSRYHASVLITGSVVQHLTPGRWCLRVVDRVRVVGRSQPVTLHEVLDALPASVLARRRASLDAWNQAWEAYQGGRFDESAAGWEAVAEADPADRLAVQWAATVRGLAAPPPQGWDGTVSLPFK